MTSPYRFDSRRFLEIVTTRWRLVVASGLLVAAVALVAAWRWSTYEASASVLVRNVDAGLQAPQVGVIPSVVGSIQSLGGTYTAILQSRPVTERVADRLMEPASAAGATASQRMTSPLRRLLSLRTMIWYLRPPVRPDTPRERLIAELRELLTGELVTQTSVFRIYVRDRDPDFAVTLARLAADAFVDYSQESNSFEASTTAQFLSSQMEDVEREQAAAEQDLQAFRDKYDVHLSLTSEGQQRVADLMALEASKDTLDLELERSRARIAKLESDLEVSPESIATSTTVDANPVVSQLESLRVTLETEITAQRLDFTEEHPQIQAKRRQLEQIDELIEAADQRMLTQEVTGINQVHQDLLTSLATERATIEGLLAQRRVLTEQIARLTSGVTALTEQQERWAELTSRVNFHRGRLDQLRTEWNRAQITQAQELSEIKVLDVSPPSPYPTLKGLPLAVFGIFGLTLGLLGGTGVALGLDALDPALKGAGPTAAVLHVPLYGVVPASPAAGNAWPDGVDSAYQRLHLRLESPNGRSGPLAGIVLTGTSEADDPAAVTFHTAAAAAAAGAEVVVIDARGGTAGPAAAPPRVEIVRLDAPEAASGREPAATLGTLVEANRARGRLVLVIAPALDRDLTAVRAARLPQVDALMLVVFEAATELPRCLETKARLDEFGLAHVGLIYVTDRVAARTV